MPFARQDSVTSVTCNGSDVIAGSVDGTVRRFDVRMGRAYADQVHAPVTCVATSHDGQCILAACLDSTLRWVWVPHTRVFSPGEEPGSTPPGLSPPPDPQELGVGCIDPRRCRMAMLARCEN
eukprot:353698-Chlamydomonas_euryale.AAC.7